MNVVAEGEDGLSEFVQIRDPVKIINLAQLNASLSNVVTLKDRLRFFHYYMNGRPLSRATRRKIYHEVWTITETKQTSFFGLGMNGKARRGFPLSCCHH